MSKTPSEVTMRAVCEAQGWRHIHNSDTLKAMTGDDAGICHWPTISGSSNYSDSVYGDWATCWAEQCGPAE